MFVSTCQLLKVLPSWPHFFSSLRLTSYTKFFPRPTIVLLSFDFVFPTVRKKANIQYGSRFYPCRRKKPKTIFRGYWRVRNSPWLLKAVQPVIYMQMHEPNCVSVGTLRSSLGSWDHARAGAIKTAPRPRTSTQWRSILGNSFYASSISKKTLNGLINRMRFFLLILTTFVTPYTYKRAGKIIFVKISKLYFLIILACKKLFSNT